MLWTGNLLLIIFFIIITIIIILLLQYLTNDVTFLFLRMITTYPESRSIFKDLKGVKLGSPQVKAHGKEITGGIVSALKSIDDIPGGMQHLRQLHHQMKVNPDHHRVSSLSTF